MTTAVASNTAAFKLTCGQPLSVATSGAATATNGTDRIWSLLNLELWFRTFIDKDGIQVMSSRGSREYSVA